MIYLLQQEVIIVEDDNGEIVREQTKDTEVRTFMHSQLDHDDVYL